MTHGAISGTLGTRTALGTARARGALVVVQHNSIGARVCSVSETSQLWTLAVAGHGTAIDVFTFPHHRGFADREDRNLAGAWFYRN